MRLSLRLAGALALAAALLTPAAWAARPTLAVLPFSIDKDVVVTDGRTVLVGTVEDQTSLLVNELVHQLVATRKFDVLERARVDDLLAEKDFQASDYAAPGEAAKLAKLLGADYFVLGRIDDLGARSEQKSLPYSSRSQVLQTAHIDLYLRIVDARSGRIVAAEKFTKETTLRDPKPGHTVGKQLITEATQVMVTRIVDSVFPLRVARVDGKVLYVNRGNDGGLKAGDALAVYRQGEAIVDQDTGETLGHAETEVARATVVAVEARYTRAELGSGEAREGMLVKKVEAAAAPAAPEELPPGPRW